MPPSRKSTSLASVSPSPLLVPVSLPIPSALTTTPELPSESEHKPDRTELKLDSVPPASATATERPPAPVERVVVREPTPVVVEDQDKVEIPWEEPPSPFPPRSSRARSSAAAAGNSLPAASPSSHKKLKTPSKAAVAKGATAGTPKSAKSVTGKGKGKKRMSSESELEESEDGGPDEERKTTAEEGADAEDDEEEEPEEGVTRCVCSTDTDEMAQGLMIQCDTCKCWQHGPCVGLYGEKDCPDRYFCEICRPGWHGPGGLLRKAHRKSLVPTPATRTKTRSPSLAPSASGQNGTTSNGRSKPRESADAAIIAAFLADSAGEEAGESSEGRRRSTSVVSHPEPRETRANGEREGRETRGGGETGARGKKRSTMNSRDAAYDDAIALSILEHGSAAMRDKLEGRDRSDSDDDENETSRMSSPPREGKTSRRASPVPSNDVSALVVEHDLMVDLDTEQDVDLEETEAKESGDDYTAPSPPSKKRKRIPTASKDLPSLPPSGRNGASLKGKERERERERELLEMEEGDESVDGTEKEEKEDGDGNDTAASDHPFPARPKHPNQYTYRPKNTANSNSHGASHAAGANRGRASPHKRGSHAANGTGGDKKGKGDKDYFEPSNHTHVPSGTWGLPEHLKHLAHLLPGRTPGFIDVPTFSTARLVPAEGDDDEMEYDSPAVSMIDLPTLPSLPSTSTDELDEHGNTILPTHKEPQTRIRFPTKRMTMPEMKKRSRSLLEFINKVQTELTETARRTEALGVTLAGGENAMESAMALVNVTLGGAGSGRRRRAEGRLREEDVLEEIVPMEGPTGESLRMMQALTKDVLGFQLKFFGSTD